MELMGTDTFLAGRQQVCGLEPLVQRNLAVFENRVDGHSELLAALIAPQKTLTSRLALNAMNAIGSDVPAVRAYGAVPPNDAFKPLVGRFFVVKMRFGQDAHDDHLSL